ncbi:MAG: hypothetical protein CL732_07415 [Chloroflexi bacterium]|nr:hypothetical protein [Chloroflexota bacterium]
MCRGQLDELADAYPQFSELGTEIVAISTDDVTDAKQMASLVNAPFQVLADASSETALAYEVFDLLDDGVAAPAVFIVDGDRVVQWKQIGQDIADRPSLGELLSVVQGQGN